MTKRKDNQPSPEILAEEHWKYVETVIFAHTGAGKDDRDYILCKHHYTSAFIHGFKHGKESVTKCN